MGRRDTSAELERALIRLVRLGRLSSIHERVVARVGAALDRSVYAVLATVDTEGPLRLSELAAHQGLDVSTVSRQVATAEQRGLIERSADPDDRRAARLALSAEGHRVLGQYRRERRRLVDAALAEWSESEREALVDLLDRLNDDLDRVSRPATVPTRKATSTSR